MAKIKFQFQTSDPKIKLMVLEFEGSPQGINTGSGEVTRNIVGLLDINVKVEGPPSTYGKQWTLHVFVNGNPIVGKVEGIIEQTGTSSHFAAHSWYTATVQKNVNA